MRRGLGIVIVTLATALALGAAATAHADVVWLCKPGVEPDPCHGSLETTVYEQDGTSRVENPPLAQDPAADCFYVYPTVSQQPGSNANKDKDPEIVAIARYQAARYSQACRVYAPMYRQQTLAGLGAGGSAEALQLAYSDVEEAWREYLAKENHGRPFVLIGHSQGTRMLRQLLRKEIDGREEVRAGLVSAILLGGNVLVRKGSRVGGDFAHVPACAGPAQIGCVVAWSTFNETPPSNSRYGRPPAEDTSGFGFPVGPDYEVLCTNPASLDVNERREITTYLRGEPFPGVIGVLLTEMYGGPQPTAPTPFLRPTDRYTARCETRDGANVLMLEPVGSSRHLNPSPDPSWGLHLSDANIALGDLVGIVQRQIAAYPRLGKPASPTMIGDVARPKLRLHIRCGKRPRVVGRDSRRVRRVRITRRGHRVRAAVRLRGGRRVVLRRRCR
ncbi:MAG TPA: DUF3089 domain-containing protein [Solirubrobacteraceae bacterium]|jgi:hypothetical protein